MGGSSSAACSTAPAAQLCLGASVAKQYKYREAARCTRAARPWTLAPLALRKLAVAERGHMSHMMFAALAYGQRRIAYRL